MGKSPLKKQGSKLLGGLGALSGVPSFTGGGSSADGFQRTTGFAPTQSAAFVVGGGSVGGPAGATAAIVSLVPILAIAGVLWLVIRSK